MQPGDLQAAVESSESLMVDPWEASQGEYQRSLIVLRSVQDRLASALRDAPSPPEGQQVIISAFSRLTPLAPGLHFRQALLGRADLKGPRHVEVFSGEAQACKEPPLKAAMSDHKKALQQGNVAGIPVAMLTGKGLHYSALEMLSACQNLLKRTKMSEPAHGDIQSTLKGWRL